MISIRTIMAAIETKMDAGIASIKEFQQITTPFPTPLQLPAVFICPMPPEKIKTTDNSNNIVYSHKYIIRLIPIISYATTQEGSLTDDTKGLMKLMDDIETLLEANMLDKKLREVECIPTAYEVSGEDFAENIYTRAGELTYIAATVPYSANITR